MEFIWFDIHTYMIVFIWHAYEVTECCIKIDYIVMNYEHAVPKLQVTSHYSYVL